MKTQNEISKLPLLQVMPPETPCDSCISERGKIFQDELVFVFCPHNCAGAVFDISGKTWHVFCPISEKEFEKILNNVLAFSRLLIKQEFEKALSEKCTVH